MFTSKQELDGDQEDEDEEQRYGDEEAIHGFLSWLITCRCGMHYVANYEFLIGWQDENVLFICVRYLQSLTQDFIYKAAE